MRRYYLPIFVTLTLAPTASMTLGQPPPAHVDHEGFALPMEAIARVGSARFRTGMSLQWLAYTPDGKTIVSATLDDTAQHGALQFWDTATGKLRHRVALKSHFRIAGLALNRDGHLLVLDADNICRTLDGTSGKELRRCTLPEDPAVYNPIWLCYSPKGSLLATRRYPEVCLFELVDGKETRRLKLKTDPNAAVDLYGQALAFTPDGTALVVATAGNLVEVFDVASGKQRCEFTAPIKALHHIELSPDGRDLFCTGYEHERVIIRDWEGKKNIVRLSKPARFTASAFSPDGTRLAVCADCDAGVTVYDAATGNEVQWIPAWNCWRLAFTPNGRTLATSTGILGTIGQWDVATGKPLPASAEPPGGLRVLRFAAGGKHLIAKADRHLLCDWQTGRLIGPCAAAESAYLREATLSPDGKLLAVKKTGQLLLLDADTGKEVHRLAHGTFAFASTGLLYVAGADKLIRVFDPKALRVRALHDPLPAPLFPVRDALVVSPDGRFIAIACGLDESQIGVWDATTGKVLFRLTSYEGAPAFSPDGRHLAIVRHVNDRMHVTFVDLRTGNEKRVIAVLDKGVAPFVFSPDGRTLVTPDYDGELRLWEVATGQERHRFEGHKAHAFAVVFSGDGALLASSGHDAPAYIWDIYGKHAKEPPAPEQWSAKESQRLWEALAGPDAKAAFQAVRRLIRSPGPAVALLRERLRPAERVEA